MDQGYDSGIKKIEGNLGGQLFKNAIDIYRKWLKSSKNIIYIPVFLHIF